MFEKKLKIQKWWSNIKLRKNKEKTGHQVHDRSAFSLVTTTFLKLLVLCFFALIILFPFFLMISTSAMNNEEGEFSNLRQHFRFFPSKWSLDGFKGAIYGSSQVSYWMTFAVTFTNVLFSIAVKLFITILFGYAFSLKKWRGKELVWAFFLSLLILPEVALLTGQYKVAIVINNKTNFSNNFFGYIVLIAIPFVASVFTALMFRNAFEAIPNRLKEVAMIDNCVGIKYLFKIAIPMVMPTTLTVVILTALAAWNAYLWPALMSSSNNQYQVLSVWLFSIGHDPEDTLRTYQNQKMAGSILVILPMFVLYFLFRSRIMRAISRQGSTIKG